MRKWDVNSLQTVMPIIPLILFPVLHWKSWRTTTCFKVGWWELKRGAWVDACSQPIRSVSGTPSLNWRSAFYFRSCFSFWNDPRFRTLYFFLVGRGLDEAKEHCSSTDPVPKPDFPPRLPQIRFHIPLRSHLAFHRSTAKNLLCCWFRQFHRWSVWGSTDSVHPKQCVLNTSNTTFLSVDVLQLHKFCSFHQCRPGIASTH